MTTDVTSPSPLALWAAGWALAALMLLAAWWRQRATADATSVDVVWTVNLGLIAGLYAWLGDGAPQRRALLALLAGAWSLRLALHLLRTRVLVPGHGEDARYAKLRTAWGPRAQRNFFWLYQGQGLLDALLSLPFLLAALDPRAEFGALEAAGTLLLVVSVAGETIADRQLARFKADPPNYFFEWLAWCAFALLALGAPLGWLGLTAPLLMLALLLKVTGVPPSEAQALRSRGDDYRDYQRTTSVFFPWIPGRGHS
jgi:steroid 5-alpha reductase family enzyme